MSFTLPDLSLALPEIFLLSAVSVLLIVDLFVSDKNRFFTYMLAQLTLFGCALVTVLGFDGTVRFTFSDMYVDDMLGDMLKLMLYIAVSVAFVYARGYLIERNIFKGEFFTLSLFALLGMMVMVSASNFLTLYLGLEILSLSMYALVALQRDSVRGTESAIKYFVLGAIASGMLLYGMSMLYGATGSLGISAVAEKINYSTIDKNILVFGLVFVVAGIAFKLGAVPFHMWVPDVYHGAPTAVTLLLSSAPKIAAFAFTFRLLAQGLAGLVQDWQGMLIILAIASMAIGNITAIAQTNLKRMLAYSAISHMGYLLLGVLSGTANGYSSAMFYIITYALMSVGGFGMVILLSRQGFEAENIDDFRGLNQRSPWYAFVMLLLMFSMAGVPPTVGFYAKLAVLQSVLQINLTWLAIVAVLFSLIGAFYYLRMVKVMYFDAPVDTAPLGNGFDMRMLLSANGLAVLVLGLLPQPLMALCVSSIEHSLRQL